MESSKRDRFRGGFTLVELVIVVIVIAVLAAMILPFLGRAYSGPGPPSCANNLKQFGIVCKMYANEAPGEMYPSFLRFTSVDTPTVDTEHYEGACALSNPPRLSPLVFQATMDWPAIYPEYVSDLSINVSPYDSGGVVLNIRRWRRDRRGYDRGDLADVVLDKGRWRQDLDGDGHGDPDGPFDPCAITAESYTYLPWAIDPNTANAETVGKFIEGLQSLISERVRQGDPSLYDADITVERDSQGEQVFFRLREGIERFHITDTDNPAASAIAQSEIPIMFDHIEEQIEDFHHVPGGANVLFLDGHVAFQKFPGTFPVTQQFAAMTEFFRGSPETP